MSAPEPIHPRTARGEAQHSQENAGMRRAEDEYQILRAAMRDLRAQARRQKPDNQPTQDPASPARVRRQPPRVRVQKKPPTQVRQQHQPQHRVQASP